MVKNRKLFKKLCADTAVPRKARLKLSWYVWLVVVYAVLKFVESLTVVRGVAAILSLALFPIDLAWLGLNIWLLVRLVRLAAPISAAVLPIWYISGFFFSIVLAVALAAQAVAFGVQGVPSFVGQSWLVWVTLLTSAFEAGYALFVLR